MVTFRRHRPRRTVRDIDARSLDLEGTSGSTVDTERFEVRVLANRERRIGKTAQYRDLATLAAFERTTRGEPCAAAREQIHTIADIDSLAAVHPAGAQLNLAAVLEHRRRELAGICTLQHGELIVGPGSAHVNSDAATDANAAIDKLDSRNAEAFRCGEANGSRRRDDVGAHVDTMGDQAERRSGLQPQRIGQRHFDRAVGIDGRSGESAPRQIVERELECRGRPSHRRAVQRHERCRRVDEAH